MKLNVLFCCVLIAFAATRCGNPKQDGHVAQSFIDSLAETRVGDLNYYISIPKGFSLKENRGPDFSVYYFTKTDSTISLDLNGGMYFGNFPSRFPAASDSCKEESIRSEILKKDAKWILYQCADEYNIQTIVGSESAATWSHEIHAFGSGRKREEIDRILYIYSTLRIGE